MSPARFRIAPVAAMDRPGCGSVRSREVAVAMVTVDSGQAERIARSITDCHRRYWRGFHLRCAGNELGSGPQAVRNRLRSVGAKKERI